jgi:phospholipid/cholesterol/gamma-HCH transport system substrate-binding protein
VDEVVGRNPAQARNLHMGDYTNLSIQMDIDLTKGLSVPGLPGPQPPVDPGKVVGDVTKCLNSRDPNSDACKGLSAKELKQLADACKDSPANPVCKPIVGGGGGGTGDGGGGGLPVPTLPGLGRAAPGDVFFGAPTVTPGAGASSAEDLGYDATLGALLIQGMVQR